MARHLQRKGTDLHAQFDPSTSIFFNTPEARTSLTVDNALSRGKKWMLETGSIGEELRRLCASKRDSKVVLRVASLVQILAWASELHFSSARKMSHGKAVDIQALNTANFEAGQALTEIQALISGASEQKLLDPPPGPDEFLGPPPDVEEFYTDTVTPTPKARGRRESDRVQGGARIRRSLPGG
ncbi:MAG: hypothetical protein LBJ77_00780 [Holosporales bacterium]|nr:hypothetical protein [Holosporales bacterium]